jgi:hypothetical protein
MRSFASKSTSEIASMGKAARAWMVEDFTDTRYRERMLALYNNMGAC